MKTLLATLAAASVLAASVAARAQDPDVALLKAKAGDQTDLKRDIDTSIPQAPGFAVIDLKPEAVVDPSLERMTMLSALQYFDDEGNLKPGFALSVRPYLWFTDETLVDYQSKSTNPVYGAFARATVSVGFADGGDGKRDRLGLGFSTELIGRTKVKGVGPDAWVYADPRLDVRLADCVGDAYIRFTKGRFDDQQFQQQASGEWVFAARDHGLRPPLPAGVNAPITGVPDGAYQAAWIGAVAQQKRQDAFAKAHAELESNYKGSEHEAAVNLCLADAAKRNEQRRSLVLAGGWAFRSKGGGDAMVDDGGSLWAAYRQPLPRQRFGETTQYMTLFARYDFDREVDVPGGVQHFDKISAAAVLGWEGDEYQPASSAATVEAAKAATKGARYKVAFQAGYERVSYQDAGPMKNNEAAFYALTVNYRLGPDLWLEAKAGSGGADRTPAGDTDERITFALRYNP